MRTLLFILSFAFLCCEGFSQEMKPAYVGSVDYAMGNFGSYDYPGKGDSVHVFIKGDKLNFFIFSTTGKSALIKSISKEFSGLPLAKKKEYENIETATKITKTGNYDMKFSKTEKGGDIIRTMMLGHYSDGSSAVLTLMTEHGGLRLYDLCVINLQRVN